MPVLIILFLVNGVLVNQCNMIITTAVRAIATASIHSSFLSLPLTYSLYPYISPFFFYLNHTHFL